MLVAFAQFGNAQPAGAQQQAQLDSSPTVFAVLAAINAAGYDADIDSPSNHPLRKALRDHLAKQKLDVVFELRRFVRDHRQRDPVADISQYISYALLSNGGPDFAFTYPDRPQPPDVAALEGFTPLLVQFYREAHIDALWKQVQPVYEKALAQYQEPIIYAVRDANVYLRNVNTGSLGRRFQIYVDLLGAPNQIHMRNYVDDYFVVVTPVAEGGELPIDQIRHVYLRYLVDPLPLKYSKTLKEKQSLNDWAQIAPLLDEAYKKDFLLLTTECFIRAIESRILRRPAMVEQSLKEGYILTPVFAEQLQIYEKQEQAMRLYFPTILDGISVQKERARLETVNFSQERTVKTVRVVTTEKPVELTGVAKTLDDAEKAYTARDLKRAQDLYLGVLKQTDEKPLHGKAYYGLARIAVFEKDPEKAFGLFEHAVAMEPDAYTKSWCLLYMARLVDSQPDRRDEAVEFYKQALAVPGLPDSVKQAAEKGLKEAYKK
jgi:tetratricopeptide (TPR) repeat protein